MQTEPFYLVTPVLLTLLFGYFHLQMQRLWEELARLPAIFPDGKPLDEKIHPWLITGIVRGHPKLLKEEPSPPFFRLQYGVAILLAWGTVPLTLIYFVARYPPGTGPWGSLFLHALTALTAAGAITAYRKARRTLELREHRPIRFRRPDPSRDERGKWVLKSAGFWIGATLLALAVAVWYAHL